MKANQRVGARGRANGSGPSHMSVMTITLRHTWRIQTSTQLGEATDGNADCTAGVEAAAGNHRHADSESARLVPISARGRSHRCFPGHPGGQSCSDWDAISRDFPCAASAPRSLLGLPATLSDSQYSLTAEVVEESGFIYVPRPRLLDLLREKPELSFHVMAMLTEELTETPTAIERTRKSPG